MAIALPADVVSWIGKDIDAARQEELVNCIALAQVWIANQAGLRSLEKEAAAITEYIDSDTMPNQDELWLSPACRPAWHTGTSSDLMTVVESGTTQGLSIGYTASSNVVIAGANRFDRVRLSRAGGWVRWGKQNIAVALKCGFDPDPAAAVNPVPLDVKRLVMEVAWLTLNSPSRAGKTSINKAGQSVSLLDELSPAGRATLDWLRGI